MGKDVIEASARAREVFARADAALGEPLSKLILEGPAEALQLTANAQPAIVTVSIALLEAVREKHPGFPAPAFAAGHSLGEYSALVAAGALTFEDAVRLVRLRGQAMQDAVPADAGAMAAVMGLDAERVTALCAEAAQGESVSPANFNGPGQTVIAGTKAAVGRACELVSAEKGKAVMLKVSAPFHCSLMAPAARALETALRQINIGRLAFPVIHNVDAEPNRDESAVKTRLIEQVDSPVRWEQTVRKLSGEGVGMAFEIGPGKVLAGLCKRIVKEMPVVSVSDAATLLQVAEHLTR